MVKTVKRPAIYARNGPSLLNFNDSVIFVCGSIGNKNVDMYRHETNTWYEGPPMKNARKSSSACTLNESIYVFGGFDIKSKPL